MFGKQFGIIGFLAVCLTSTLFLALATTGTTSSSEYDPWVDLNDDGVIDSTDLGMLGVAWGSTGTPINKTALLLELQSKIDVLNSTILELETTINYLNSTIVYLNETVVYLNSTGLGAPDYDSGWLSFPPLTYKTITHNLGTREIIVYMFGRFGGSGNTHQRSYGGDSWDAFTSYGAFWESMDENSIWVYNAARGTPDDFWKYVRVLIWGIP
jgi:hypothetical protein